ncbi:unnamed protein product, partial [Phaeothamnion confervicola]
GWSPTFWTLGYGILTGPAAPQDASELPAVNERPSVWRRIWPALSRIMSPPIVACAAGLAVGLFVPLRRLLMPTAGAAAAGTPLLGPLWRALTLLAAAYTPSGILVLAGSLANGPPAGKLSLPTVKKLAAAAAARWLLVPAAVASLLPLAVRAGLVPNDPILLFVLLMQA